MEWVQAFTKNGVVHAGEVIAVLADSHLSEGLRGTLEVACRGEEVISEIRGLDHIIVAPFTAPNPIQVGFGLLSSRQRSGAPRFPGWVSCSLQEDSLHLVLKGIKINTLVETKPSS